jgi:glycerophosphoryl diester phosphodiesterase
MRTGAVPPLDGYTPDDFSVPRFEDIVRRYPDMPLNIEIKGTGAPAIAAAYELARILTDEHRLSNAVVTSFDDLVVDAFHELAPTVEVTPGLGLSSDFVLEGKPLPEGMRILQLPVQFEDIEVLTPATIAAAHAAGYVIWVWPDDRKWENPAGYMQLLEMGLDGLNINVPDQGVQAVQDFTG